ncbi:Ribosomal protein S18 acetylase RimI [Austwickia chelonae]|nr:Ribosomal protein S18 acetylase RimI [Austwickia chelonae]
MRASDADDVHVPETTPAETQLPSFQTTQPDQGSTRTVVRLRLAQPEDAPQMMDLEAAVNVAALPHIFPPEQYPYPRDFVLERWTKELQDPTFRIWVAEATSCGETPGTPREKRIVAYCACCEKEGEAWLEHLGVATDLQGSGLARMLVDNARTAYTGREVNLWVLEENRRARRFYEREGWNVTGITMPAIYPPYPTMVRYLAPPA